MQRIVLAFSGGLTTSVAVPWLRERYGADVIAVTMDLGQGPDLEAVRDRAVAAGAIRAHVLDVRDEFARDFIVPALQADALYDGRYPLTAALARPLIAQKLVEIARMEGASAVAHGSSGEGADHFRLDMTIRTLDSDLAVIAPARDWSMTRAAQVEFARARGIAAPADGQCRVDVNLWGRLIASGPSTTVLPDDVFALTASSRGWPETPAHVEVAFESGVPVAINGVAMSLPDLIASLTTIGGAHGVGRLSVDADGSARDARSEVLEAPAAVVLHCAHQELSRRVNSPDLDSFCQLVSAQYADLVFHGLWWTPLREALDAFVDRVQRPATGVVRLRLFKGSCTIVGDAVKVSDASTERVASGKPVVAR